MEKTQEIKVLFVENRYCVRGTQSELSMFDRGIETKAQDMLDIGKDGKAKLVLIKKNADGRIEVVNKPIGSNLTDYTQLVLVDLEPKHLMASVEETKTLIANPEAIIVRELSSGARFTEKDLEGLPKEAHSLIYKLDANGVRTYNVINVNTNKDYQKYGIKSQVDRGVSRTLCFHVDNLDEIKTMSEAQRKQMYYKYHVVLCEFKPNEKE